MAYIRKKQWPQAALFLTSISLVGYFHSDQFNMADPDNYFMFDELVVSNSYIGPPEGFLSGDGGNVVDTEPPTIVLSLPTSSSTYTTTNSSVNLAGSASDNVGVTSNNLVN